MPHGQDNYSAPVAGMNPGTAPQTQKDKKVKSGRQKSPFRDAEVMRDLQALPAIPSPGVSPRTLVIESHLPSPSTTTHSPSTPSPTIPLSPDILEGLRRFIASLSKQQQAKARKSSGAPPARFPLWYEAGGSFGVPVHRPRRAPTPWRDATDYLRLEYFHRALQTLGPVHSFTLNLSHDIEALARRQKNPGDWLRRRIARRLETGLGRAVDFWLVLELDRDHFDESTGRKRARLHIHGELQASADEIEKARACLRLAGGEWEKNRQFQVQTKPDPDTWWAGYCTKEFRGIKNIFWDEDQCRLTFQQPLPGLMVSVTRPVNAKAREIFEKERAKLLRRR